MKRFIDLGTQLYAPVDENDPECWAFAWWDTVIDRFETYGDSQTWESWEEFEMDFRFDYVEDQPKAVIEDWLARYKGLYPKDKP